MSVTYDFQIVDTNLCGVSQIIPQNEDALRYLVEEAHFSTFADGTAALFEEYVADFISDCGWAHLSCEYV